VTTSRYLKARRLAIQRGQWHPMTGAAPAREHVRRLLAAGMTASGIAATAGVSPGSLHHLLHGGQGRPPARTVRRETARRLLAVRPPGAALPAAHATLDATGTRRRIQALAACGWTQSRLARELGWDPSALSAMMRGQRGWSRVRVSTAAAVRDMYERLWDVPPPRATRREASDARSARARAAERGWPPPAAWDDDAIDDPAAGPADGWQRGRQLSLADRAEEAAELIRWTGSRGPAGERDAVRDQVRDHLRRVS
jgi:transcriptional regulator with XRE-family HTH domain